LITGRWDAIVHLRDRGYASWFEIRDNNGLSGRFVGIEGSARHMTELSYEQLENRGVLTVAGSSAKRKARVSPSGISSIPTPIMIISAASAR